MRPVKSSKVSPHLKISNYSTDYRVSESLLQGFLFPEHEALAGLMPWDRQMIAKKE